MNFSDTDLASLRDSVGARLSEKRFIHVLGVERCAKRLGEALLPELVGELRAAALLHDIAKEIPISEQLDILRAANEPLDEDDLKSEGVIHSFAAPLIIIRDFPKFATDDILSATRNHTVGVVNMTVFDKIVFISDYVEDTRIFQSCVTVRGMLFDGFEKMNYEEALKRLNESCIAAIDGANEALTRMNKHINPKVFETRKSLLKEILQT